MSQGSLAAKIGYSRPYVTQVELAREIPAPDFFRACDQALATNGALMELFRRVNNERRSVRSPPVAVSADLWTPGDGTTTGLHVPAELLEPSVERRTFLRNATILAGTAAASPAAASVAARGAEPWERLTEALRGRTAVDGTTVENLERVTLGLERLEAQLSPKALIGAVTGHLDAIAQLLRTPMRAVLRRRLCSVAAETAALAGWLTWDLDSPETASSYFRAGLEAADDADDRAIGAYLVGGLCVQPSFREQPQGRLRRLEGQTLGFAQDDATPATRAWLASLEAEAHVLAGDERSALLALDRADRTMESAAEDEPTTRRPRVTFFDTARLRGERGVALARLGRADQAEAVLNDAMSSLDKGMVKIRPRLLAELASSHVQNGNIDAACQAASDALTLAAELQVEPSLQDVYRIRRGLEPWRTTTAVQDLDRQLAQVNVT